MPIRRDSFAVFTTRQAAIQSLQITAEVFHVFTQAVEKTLHMVAICGGVVAGDGQRKKNAAGFFGKLSRFNRGKIVWLVIITVNGEMRKRDPGYA